MKSILISIKPKWVAKILNGEKTIEIRKTMPKCKLPIDVYIYCTKEKKYLTRGDNGKTYPSCVISNGIQEWHLNGKVVAKFTLNKAEEITYLFGACETFVETRTLTQKDICSKSCLTKEQILNYLNVVGLQARRLIGYAWHISNLVIFDKPKELSEFRHRKQFMPSGYMIDPLNKAPQSWQFIEVE